MWQRLSCTTITFNGYFIGFDIFSIVVAVVVAFSALTPLFGRQEEHAA